jgi:hypothetical protein
MGAIERNDEVTGPRLRPMPGWATALVVLGWLIVGVAIVGAVLFAIGVVVDRHPRDLLGVTIGFTGAVIAVATLGTLPVIFGRSRRPGADLSRMKLWAKCVIAVGTILSLAVPLFFVGVILDVLSRYDALEGPETIIGAAAIAFISFLAGAAAIVSALVWGRRKQLSAIAHVFD